MYTPPVYNLPLKGAGSAQEPACLCCPLPSPSLSSSISEVTNPLRGADMTCNFRPRDFSKTIYRILGNICQPHLQASPLPPLPSLFSKPWRENNILGKKRGAYSSSPSQRIILPPHASPTKPRQPQLTPLYAGPKLLDQSQAGSPWDLTPEGTAPGNPTPSGQPRSDITLVWGGGWPGAIGERG